LRQALAMPELDWQRMSTAAQALARTHFSAETVAAQWVAIYRGLAGAV
jgi:glycosyltransferase involved in cell wall biosynthesis